MNENIMSYINNKKHATINTTAFIYLFIKLSIKENKVSTEFR
jgi:hypothetical protein